MHVSRHKHVQYFSSLTGVRVATDYPIPLDKSDFLTPPKAEIVYSHVHVKCAYCGGYEGRFTCQHCGAAKEPGAVKAEVLTPLLKIQKGFAKALKKGIGLDWVDEQDKDDIAK